MGFALGYKPWNKRPPRTCLRRGKSYFNKRKAHNGEGNKYCSRDAHLKIEIIGITIQKGLLIRLY